MLERGLSPTRRPPRPVSSPPWASSTGGPLSSTRGPPRSSPGRPSASGSRGPRHGRLPGWARRPGTCPTWWAPWVRARSASTRCGPLAEVATPESDRRAVRAGQGLLGARTGRGGPDERRPAPVALGLGRRSLRARPALPALQRRLADPVAPAARRVLCRDQDLSRGPGQGDPLRGETPLDQRLCDAFMGLVRSATPGAVEPGHHGEPAPRGGSTCPSVTWSTTQATAPSWSAELERGGLIDADTVQRLACDATVVVAARRRARATPCTRAGPGASPPMPSAERSCRRDRRCRFPGCSNATFTNVHHMVPWKPGGRTDLDNLALLVRVPPPPGRTRRAGP